MKNTTRYVSGALLIALLFLNLGISKDLVSYAAVDNLTEERILQEEMHQGGSPDHVRALAEGKESSFIVTMGGTLWSKGRNEQGQLGVGNFDYGEEFQPVLEDVIAVSAGYEHAAAIKEDGSLFLWGNNEEGQSGVGKGQNSSLPQLVLQNVKQVSAGGSHTLAVGADGVLWAWGSNAVGELGNGKGGVVYAPTKVMPDVAEAGAGFYFSAARKTDGSLWTWGWNEKGRLGSGSTRDSKTPIKIMENVTAISVGSSHALALQADGSLWAWGDNDHGQLGDGATEHRYTPIRIMEDVADISAGYYSSAAVKTDGSLWVWGANKGFWLGQEAKQSSSVPVNVKQNVKLVSLGRVGSLVATGDGSIFLDSITDNSIVTIQEGRPVLLQPALTILEHNELVRADKREDGPALQHYLKATEAIQSDSPEIQELAAEITADAQSEAEKLAAIHTWVCQNLYYNFDVLYSGAGTGTGDISALGALSERVTVCSGYSNLTAALLRASGIPAKYISGYAAQTSENAIGVDTISVARNAHAWNEAWIDGRWVILDTTWNCRNRFRDGTRTSLPHIRAYLDPQLDVFSESHMIKQYTEFKIN